MVNWEGIKDLLGVAESVAGEDNPRLKKLARKFHAGREHFSERRRLVDEIRDAVGTPRYAELVKQYEMLVEILVD